MFNKSGRMQDSLSDDRNHGPSHDDSTPKLNNKTKDKNALSQIFVLNKGIEGN